MVKILLIDDEEDVLNTISMVLKTMGCHVVQARDGEEGISRFEELSFDIVITDLIMPNYNGNDVARYIRNARDNIKIIGITGTPEKAEAELFDILMIKPFSINKLIEYIKLIENN